MRMRFAAALAVASLVASAAHAQMLCGPRHGMGEMLAARFGEVPRAAGLSGDRIAELLVSPEGSWTILITTTDGMSCIVTGGEDWIEKPVRQAAPVEAPKGKGA